MSLNKFNDIRVGDEIIVCRDFYYESSGVVQKVLKVNDHYEYNVMFSNGDTGWYKQCVLQNMEDLK